MPKNHAESLCRGCMTARDDAWNARIRPAPTAQAAAPRHQRLQQQPSRASASYPSASTTPANVGPQIAMSQPSPSSSTPAHVAPEVMMSQPSASTTTDVDQQIAMLAGEIQRLTSLVHSLSEQLQRIRADLDELKQQNGAASERSGSESFLLEDC